jgi:acyl carrier protein
MTVDELKATVKKTVVSVMGAPIEAEAINDSASYKDDLGLDSLAILEIAVELDRVFEIEVPEEELASILTIQDTVEVIQKYCALKEHRVEVATTCDDGLLSPA